jgi:hypothetical protein
MKRFHIAVFAAALFGLLPLAGNIVSALADENKQPHDDLRRTIRTAESSDDVAKSYKSLFKEVKREDLRKMQMDPEDSIAFHAAWELLKMDRESELTKKLLMNKRDEVDVESVEPAVIQRFLGFVEGKLGMELPKWWELFAIRARVYASGVWFYPAPKMSSIVKDAKIRKTAGNYVVTQLGDSFTVKARILDSAPDPSDGGVAASLDASRCFLASYDSDRGFSFPLICVDRNTEKLLWKARVWACDRKFSTGIGYHIVSLRVTKSRIVVFGADPGGMYIEAFDIKTGDNVLRFSTCWWSSERP